MNEMGLALVGVRDLLRDLSESFHEHRGEFQRFAGATEEHFRTINGRLGKAEDRIDSMRRTSLDSVKEAVRNAVWSALAANPRVLWFLFGRRSARRLSAGWRRLRNWLGRNDRSLPVPSRA